MKKKSMNKLILRIEKIGNALPHPIYIFLFLIFIIIILSGILNGCKVNNIFDDSIIEIKSLLNRDGIIWFLTHVVQNFIEFPPLGMVLVTALGVGIAEETGLMKILMISMIRDSPRKLVTPIVLFVAIVGNLAGSAAFVIIPPLAALVFKAVGKHPLGGLAAGFMGVAGGLSANLFITPTDVVNSGITQAVVAGIDKNLPVNPAINWYFMIASSVVLTIVGTLVIEKITLPSLGKYSGNSDQNEEIISEKSDEEKKALRSAGLMAVIYIFVIMLTIIPSNGILRGENGSIVPSPFLDSMIIILTGLFLFPSIIYGIKVGIIRCGMDLICMFEKSMNSFSGFIVMCFFAAQFVELFSYTNFGTAIASIGARFISNKGFDGAPLIIMFILFTAFVNFFIGILSAKWSLLAPVFIPMFMNLGMTPYFTQAAFRIADSVTNPISPLEAFMPLMIVYAKKYDENAGLGTIIALMLPLSVAFFIFWTMLLFVWYYLNLPLGPGAGIFYFQ